MACLHPNFTHAGVLLLIDSTMAAAHGRSHHGTLHSASHFLHLLFGFSMSGTLLFFIRFHLDAYHDQMRMLKARKRSCHSLMWNVFHFIPPPADLSIGILVPIAHSTSRREHDLSLCFLLSMLAPVGTRNDEHLRFSSIKRGGPSPS